MITTGIKDFVSGLFQHLHVIHALILRETRTRFGKHSLGYVWAFMEPFLNVGVFFVMFYFLNRQTPAGTDAIGFLCTGFLTFYVFTGTLNKAQTAVQANLALLYYPQVQTLDLVVARCALETVTLGVAFFIFMLFSTMQLHHLPLDSAAKTIMGLSFASLLGTGIGLIFNGLVTVFPTIEHFISLITRPLFWLSGLFWGLNEIPQEYRGALLWNPILHIVELTRDGWYKTYNYEYYSYSYILLWILGAIFFGLVSEKMTRKYVVSG
ncbi:MAG: ABC transporter permease [Deltaproteobacteria bacterium]|nr:ABC transporter permease [Deltaproteobacteria bacterium]